MTFLEHEHSFEEYFPPFDKEKLLMRYFWRIYNMVHRQNFNFLAMVTGKHRSGKSLTAINFADLLDKDFAPNLEKRVVYTPSQFIHCLDEIRQLKKVGSCIVWDESGIAYGSRDWQSSVSKSLGYEIQALGYLRPIIFFVSQDMSFLDSQPRKLLHGVFEVSRYNEKFNEVKPFFLEYNTWNSRTYRHYPIYVGRWDATTVTPVCKIKKIRVKVPNLEIIKRYEKHSQQFKDLCLSDVKAEVDMYESGLVDNTKPKSINDIVESVNSNVEDYLTITSSVKNPILDKDLIRFGFGISEAKARAIKNIAQKKLMKKS